MRRQAVLGAADYAAAPALRLWSLCTPATAELNGELSFSSCVPLGTPSSETIGRTRRPGKWAACLGPPSLVEHYLESGPTLTRRIAKVGQPYSPGSAYVRFHRR